MLFPTQRYDQIHWTAVLFWGFHQVCDVDGLWIEHASHHEAWTIPEGVFAPGRHLVDRTDGIKRREQQQQADD